MEQMDFLYNTSHNNYLCYKTYLVQNHQHEQEAHLRGKKSPPVTITCHEHNDHAIWWLRNGTINRLINRSMPNSHFPLTSHFVAKLR